MADSLPTILRKTSCLMCDVKRSELECIVGLEATLYRTSQLIVNVFFYYPLRVMRLVRVSAKQELLLSTSPRVATPVAVVPAGTSESNTAFPPGEGVRQSGRTIIGAVVESEQELAAIYSRESGQ